MSTNSIKQLLTRHGIDRKVRTATSINGNLLLALDQPITDQDKKIIADLFCMYKKVTII